MKAWILWSGVLLAWLLISYLIGGISYFFEVPAILLVLFGWMRFLIHNVPRMTFDPPAVTLGVAAAVLFVVVAHLVLRSLVASRPASSSHNPLPRRPLGWKWRWTFAMLAVVMLMFTAGISIVGLTHQVVWLVTSSAPAYDEVLGGYYGGSDIGSYTNKLKGTGVAFQAYQDTYKALPESPESRLGTGLHSWETMIAPYLNYYLQDIHLSKPWNDPINAPTCRKLFPDFLNPSFSTDTWRNREEYGQSHYAANERVLGPAGASTLDEISDGTSNTLLMGEVDANFEPWGKPGNWRDPTVGLNRSPHGFGCPRAARIVFFVMADGSVRTVRDDIDPDVLRHLATPAGYHGPANAATPLPKTPTRK